MGRPRKAANELRDVPVTIMVTEEERARIEQLAGPLTMSEFLRRRAFGRPMPANATEQKNTAALTTALLRIGVNLNQIAHRLNAGHRDTFGLVDLLADIRFHIERLSRDEPR
jgi:hypothetical protein